MNKQSSKPQTTSAEYCTQGQKMLDNGRFMQAMEFFQAAIETDKNYEKAYLLLASSYEKQGKFDKAMAALYSLLTIEPNHKEAFDRILSLKSRGIISQSVVSVDNREPVSSIVSSLMGHAISSETVCHQPSTVNYRIIDGKPNDAFDFFIVYDDGNKLYFKTTEPWKNEVAVVSPSNKHGHFGAGYWEGYKKPEGAIEIPSIIDYNGKPYTVKSIGSYAFIMCDKIIAVTFSNAITSIGSDAFRYCKSLETVAFPPSLEIIGPSCFAGCSLKTIDFPKSINNIGYGAFSGCNQLKSLRFPDSIDVIQEQTLAGCEMLTTIVIPESVNEIQFQAFGSFVYGDAANQIHLIMESKKPPKVSKDFIGNRLYGRRPIKVIVTVPKGASEAYMNAQYWQLYDIIEN